MADDTVIRPLRLLVVDDHEVVRQGLVALLDRRQGFEVVAEAGTVAEAIEQSRRYEPDIVIMDVRLPDGSGVEACREIRAERPATRVVMLTSYPDEEAVLSAIVAGASGYLLKQSGLDDVLHCVRQVAAGRRYLAPGLAEKLAGRVDANRLSRREMEILAHLAAGMSNKVIARTENIGVGTVKYHVNNILSKLNVSCRTEAACVAARRGLIHAY